MNRKNFGKIVKSLRQEQIDYMNGRSWTQKDFAEAAMLSDKTVENIEQGKRVNLTKDELRKMADALRLSTLERHEFFIAATNDDGDDNIDEPKAKDSFNFIWEKFSATQLPSYLTDPLYNIIGINRPMMLFHGITSEILERARQTDIGCNMLSLFFRPNSPLREAMHHRWYEPAISNIRQFQFTALGYRYSSRFNEILAFLYKYPDFARLWQQSRGESIDMFSMLRVFDYIHVQHGAVHYATTVTKTLTPCGPLYTTIFVPCSSQTNIIFNELGQTTQGAQKVMAWPDVV